MICTRPVVRHRCLAVVAAGTLGYGVLVAWLLPIATTAGGGTFEAALVRICAALGVVAAGWLWLVTVLTVDDALRGRARAGGGATAPVRRVVLAACGVALVGGLATGTAQATPGRLHEDRTARSATILAGLPLPERAVAPPPRRTVVVAPGDSLWAIAARTLGPGASDGDIDALWRRLYDLNRDAIGPDPDVIHPAQRLEVLP
ncbi:hypothetical protein ASC77_06845 [Nocardioides sp. Root1257]|uniref:LysM peptidoglycan-binding domain-containing protein n=1 Tax=unclassified Nocardioides TaxID=2615069 RepID=UPI0006F7F94D|nr:MULTISPECIES: LysM domain-containing protein [unclassified Nocardioides]KQW48469.1 hypothetical protein ASC77_06845 [Nocardioides sp. Root1257]KRC47644.1 hypothetical protein ASE24_06845 [Nocardioides sp. Root224]